MNISRETLSLTARRIQAEAVQSPVSRPEAPLRKELDRDNGHEIILRTMISKRQRILLTFKDNTCVKGRISQFDRWTITVWLDEEHSKPETFFKHDIRSFTTAE